jgi:hypothetical protein
MQAAATGSQSKYQIKKEDIPKIKTLIESIEADPNAEPFLMPVQWEGKNPQPH